MQELETFDRRTFDGRVVRVWSDGAVATTLGYHIPGIGARRFKMSAPARGWSFFLGEVALYTWEELAQLFEAARWLDASPARTCAQARSRATRRPDFPIQWTVTGTDVQGNTTERWGRLHRMTGLSDFAICHERGRYIVCTIDRSGGRQVAYPSMTYSTQREVQAYLHQNADLRNRA